MRTAKNEYAKRLRVWIKALRSGEFKQTRGKYHGRNGGHCCLGVGQIVLGLPIEESDSKLRCELGIETSDSNYLVGLNDFGHRSFAYIADKIQERILPRFLTKA